MGEEIEVLDAQAPLQVARKNEADLKTESELVDNLRTQAKRASEIEADLLERVGNITDKNMLPQALRAVADAKTKSIDGLLKMTGREGQDAADDFTTMLRGMAQDGFLKLNVSLEAGPRSTDD